MLKVSFRINHIQNTLQRHYHRVQTILVLEQNMLEDRDEIGQNHVVPNSNFLEIFETEKLEGLLETYSDY